jgi:cobalt/nickel transport system ATP-binding protein
MSTLHPLLRLHDISFAHPGGTKLLEQLNLTIDSGQKIGLIGPNGSGKTTLLHLIMGLIPLQEGKIFFQGKEVKGKDDLQQLRRGIGMVFQDADDQLFSPTVLEDVAFGPLNLGLSPAEALHLAHTSLAELGLSSLAERITSRLSGGEKKLVSLATVLCMQPDLLLLDEPSNTLDPETRTQCIALLKGLPLGYLIISHDWDFLSITCQQVYSLNQGHLIPRSMDQIRSQLCSTCPYKPPK